MGSVSARPRITAAEAKLQWERRKHFNPFTGKNEYPGLIGHRHKIQYGEVEYAEGRRVGTNLNDESKRGTGRTTNMVRAAIKHVTATTSKAIIVAYNAAQVREITAILNSQTSEMCSSSHGAIAVLNDIKIIAAQNNPEVSFCDKPSGPCDVFVHGVDDNNIFVDHLVYESWGSDYYDYSKYPGLTVVSLFEDKKIPEEVPKPEPKERFSNLL